MKKTEIQIENTSIDELLNSIDEVIKQNLRNHSLEKKPSDKPVYGTRHEVAMALHISLPTLNVLTKTGKLKGYRLNGRVLYRWEEVNEALIEIPKLKYRGND